MGVVRQTKSVRIILDRFENHTEALSVVDLVKDLGDVMNKTTIYRILDRLDEDGVLHSFLGKDGMKWYAKCQSCSAHEHHDVHPHFQCKSCGKTECLSIEVTIPAITNKHVESAQVLILGECDACHQD